jgi:hypothetical protein
MCDVANGNQKLQAVLCNMPYPMRVYRLQMYAILAVFRNAWAMLAYALMMQSSASSDVSL